MPLYIDIHELHGATAADVAQAHVADVEIQAAHGVNYLKYWVNESCGKAYCLVDAPNPEAAVQVHMEAHGLAPGRIIEVQPEIVDAFVGGGRVNAAGAALAPQGGALDPGTRTIVFTDIVDSTSFVQKQGDQAAMRLLELHDSIVRSCLATFRGREVKHMGDGIMACFASAPDAVNCTVRIQRQIAERVERESGHPLRLRIGAAAGEPVEHQGDFFGLTVNLAARLCARAAPEQILVSSAVVDLCHDAVLRFDDLGEVSLKGFEGPVRAHAVA